MTDSQSNSQQFIDTSRPPRPVEAGIPRDYLAASCRALLEACELAVHHVPPDIAKQVQLAIDRTVTHTERPCDQRNCIRAVSLTHLVRRATVICDDQGYNSVGDFLRHGLAASLGEKPKETGTPCELGELLGD